MTTTIVLRVAIVASSVEKAANCTVLEPDGLYQSSTVVDDLSLWSRRRATAGSGCTATTTGLANLWVCYQIWR